MGFHIGQQNAATINNVAGDQTIHGGQHALFVADPAQALSALRTALAATPLREPAAAAATAELTEATAAIDRAEPDRPRAAAALERLTRVLTSAGALAGAATALISPLQALAAWLGPVGATLMSLLPRL